MLQSQTGSFCGMPIDHPSYIIVCPKTQWVDSLEALQMTCFSCGTFAELGHKASGQVDEPLKEKKRDLDLGEGVEVVKQNTHF